MLALARASRTGTLARTLRMFSVKPRGKKSAKSEGEPAAAESSSPTPSVPAPTSSSGVPMDAGKRRALDTAMKQIEQQFGKGAIMRLGARPDNSASIPTFSTGSIGLDMALGCGGVPKGRVIEVYGPEASGKTTLALHIIAQAQKVGGSCAFIDAEHALDANYAQRLGIDLDNLLVSQPDSGEQALEMCDTLVRSGSVDLVVIDSVAALVPKAEIEGEMGDSHMALQARLMSQALRKLTAHLSKHNTTLLFINQIRSKVGVMFGSPEVTSGGNALKYYASQRMDIRRIAPLKVDDVVIGNRVRVKVVKNKMAPPFREAEFDVEFGSGISRVGEIIDLGVAQNVLTRAGAWFSYGEHQLGQGRDKSKAYLQQHPALLDEIEKKLRTVMAAAKTAIAVPKADVDEADAEDAADSIPPAEAPKTL